MANEPREAGWLTANDLAMGELALSAINSLKKTFEHWMTQAVFFRRIREISNEHGGGRNSFQVMLLLNGIDETKIKFIGGKTTISRLEAMAAKETEVREWYNNLPEDKKGRWNAPTTIEKWCPALQRQSQIKGVTSDKKLKQASLAAQLKEAERVIEQKDARIKEVEEESEGSLFDLSRDTVDDIARVIVGRNRSKAERIARAILKLLKEPAPAG
jgi:hypothetical protein